MDLEYRTLVRAPESDTKLVYAALRRGLSTLSSEEFPEVLAAAHRWQNEEVSRILSARSDAFRAVGGCEACEGRGWIVAWDTMDSMSGAYADIGSCPRSPGAADDYRDRFQVAPEHAGTCTEESRERTGQNKAVPKEYRGMRQDRRFSALADFPLDETERKELRAADETLAAAVAEGEARKIEIGRPVRVVRGFRVVAGKRKGRGKLPLGLKGEIEWKGETRYGEAIRVRVGEGADEVVLTSLGNVEVIR